MAKTAPYGSWKSPITTDVIVADSIKLSELYADGSSIYYSELRPSEKGRMVLLKVSEDGSSQEVLPEKYSVRTKVHDYGGGSFVVADGIVYFCNFSDQQLYRKKGEEVEKVTDEKKLRFSDMRWDGKRNLLYTVCEDHKEKEARNFIGCIDPESNEVRPFVQGNDFYSSPRVNQQGTHLCYLTWNHPNMPWDGCELWTHPIEEEGKLGKGEKIAGGLEESIFQPEWGPDNALYFVSDQTGFWNLYRFENGTVTPLCKKDAEFGEPAWQFGYSTYAFISGGNGFEIICTYIEKGAEHLAKLKGDSLEDISSPYTSFRSISSLGKAAVLFAGSPTTASQLVRYDGQNFDVLKRSREKELDSGYISVPQNIEFPTSNRKTAFGFFYPPKNKDHQSPGEKPPLIVKSHGGPTAYSACVLNPEIQYWTSRGIAVVDVNYGGSTGFGREYRKRLNDNWGIVDVQDCVNAAVFLAKEGEADAKRLAIKGGSAGGYTTLCALTFTDVFRAGASYYGVSDPEILAKDTHKFESRYLDHLIGPYPEQRQKYLDRSPIHHVDQLSCPVILLQGDEDAIVPPNQAEMMFDAVKEKGLMTSYLLFKGEQHGFRAAENIQRALEAENYFYSRVFGYEPADTIKPIPIENL